MMGTMTTRRETITTRADQFRMPDGRLARQVEIEDENGNVAGAIVAYNGVPKIGGDAWIEVFATEAWVIDRLATSDLDSNLLVATFHQRAERDAAHAKAQAAK